MPEITFKERFFKEFYKEYDNFSSLIKRTISVYDKNINADICPLCGINAEVFGNYIKEFISQALDKQKEEILGCLPDEAIYSGNVEDYNAEYRAQSVFRQQFLDNLNNKGL